MTSVISVRIRVEGDTETRRSGLTTVFSRQFGEHKSGVVRRRKDNFELKQRRSMVRAWTTIILARPASCGWPYIIKLTLSSALFQFQAGVAVLKKKALLRRAHTAASRNGQCPSDRGKSGVPA